MGAISISICCFVGFLLAFAGLPVLCCLSRLDKVDHSHFLVLCLAMPSVARLDWILMQIQMGRQARISTAAAFDSSRAKLRVVLLPASDGAISPILAQCLMEQLTALRPLIHSVVSVDRGHRHHDGMSEICFWLSFPAAACVGVNKSGG